MFYCYCCCENVSSHRFSLYGIYIIRCRNRTYLLSPMMFKSRYCPSLGVIDLPIILMWFSFVLMTCKCCIFSIIRLLHGRTENICSCTDLFQIVFGDLNKIKKQLIMTILLTPSNNLHLCIYHYLKNSINTFSILMKYRSHRDCFQSVSQIRSCNETPCLHIWRISLAISWPCSFWGFVFLSRRGFFFEDESI